MGADLQQAWSTFGELVRWFMLGLVLTVPIAGFSVRRRLRRLCEPLSVAVVTVAVRMATAVALLFVLAITLQPMGDGVDTSANWFPFVSITELVSHSVDASVAVRNVLFNVLLFVPVGIAGAMLASQFNRTWRSAALAGVALSVLIELIQLAVPLRRAVDVDDVVLNSVGVVVGVLIGEVARRLLDRCVRQSIWR